MTPEAIQARLGISDDRLAALTVFVDLLEKWQRRINLVAPATVPDVWNRHVLDSAQLWPLIEPLPGPVLDLGSGAGFPGLVLAILGRDDVVLVESDTRKAAFLREAARLAGAQVTVEACRIESLHPIRAGIVTSRALATVDRILHYAQSYSDESTVYFLLKGGRADAELTTAESDWRMRVQKIPSITDERGVVLRLEGVTHVEEPGEYGSGATDSGDR